MRYDIIHGYYDNGQIHLWKAKTQMKNGEQSIKNQVIVNRAGHSWLGFHTINKKFLDALSEILVLSERYKEQPDSFNYKNAFWVLDKDGSCVCAQPSLDGALRYYNEDRILVHYQSKFI